MELFVKTVAFQGAPAEIHINGQTELRELFPEITFRFVSEKPDLIYFLTGGSEQEAVAAMQTGKHFLLLAGFENNAYAAGMEVKAWADEKKISSSLVSLHEAEEKKILNDHALICSSLRLLNKKHAALIGNVSKWLVASEFPFILAKERFGINILHLQWSNLPDFMSFDPDPEFFEVFKQVNKDSLTNEARFYSFLKHILNEFNISGLTVECFQLVNTRNITACLALAILNNMNIAAGCEGDLVSLAGMMLVQALTGHIPWMANVAGFNGSNLLFAHCTAPVNLLDEIELPTHFETNKSFAVTGKLKMEDVTIFRMNQHLDRAFISTGKIISQPRHSFACRTQAEITVSETDFEKLLKQPLGNHHLIFPGDHREILARACRYKQVQII